MKIVRQPREFASVAQPTSLAIGMFDGVHLGHQQVIRQTITDARQHGGAAVAITFDCHPNSVVAPERNPPLIYTLAQKLRVLESLGVEATWLIHFDLEFSRQRGEDFVRELVRRFHPVTSVCVGSSFTFGHKRSGNVALLKRLGQELSFTVHGLAAVALDGKVVSSTRVRDALRDGNFDSASQMLGRAYALEGKVIHGAQQGRLLGFPTANLDTTGLLLPPDGVYAAQVQAQRSWRQAVVNIGRRPTIQTPSAQPVLEAHLLGFDGDLYGSDLEVAFTAKLRDERKFASRDELQAQIKRDIDAARRFFS